MVKRLMAITTDLIVIVVISLGLLSYNAYAMLEDKVHDALIAIRDADSVGADTKYLVDRLNNILNLIKEVDDGSLKSCLSKDECIAKVNSEIDALINDSRILKETTASKNLNTLAMNMLVYAPIAGFIASLVITILYTNLKDYLKRRIMEMEVRRVEEE
jgi:hypothetical protein